MRITNLPKDVFGRLQHLWEMWLQAGYSSAMIQERLALLQGRGLDRIVLEGFFLFCNTLSHASKKLISFLCGNIKISELLFLCSDLLHASSLEQGTHRHIHTKYWDEIWQICFVNQLLIWCLSSTKECFRCNLNYTSIIFLPISTIMLHVPWNNCCSHKAQRGKRCQVLMSPIPKFSRKEKSCLSSKSG